jgi:two-component system sensor histidine kinase/response regulator
MAGPGRGRPGTGPGERFIVLSRDITARMSAEAELESYRHRLEQLVADRTAELEQARAQADAANRAKSPSWPA